MKNRKRAAVIGLAALTIVGGTLAYYNATTKVSNPFSTGSYEGTTVEKFNPKDGEDWQPGSEVEKLVGAKNTGSSDLWVRIKFEENWKNAEKNFDSALAAFFPTAANGNQADPSDGLTAADNGSVVYKDLKNIVEADSADAGWVKGTDGYYYWNQTLAKDQSTGNLLESVTLCKDADMGKYETKTYYAVVDKDAAEPEFNQADNKVWTDSLDGKDTSGKTVYSRTITELTAPGYAKDNYTLSIVTEFVQTDKDAAADWEVTPGK